MSVEAAVERDLERMGGDLRDSALGASALALAAEIDSPENSATSKSMCAARLMEAMDRLRALAPPKREADGLDEIGAKRTERLQSLAGSAAASDLSRP